MAINFGTGLALKDASPWLQDDAERLRRILDVTERNSVIEGLPPLQEETRRSLLAELTSHTREPDESQRQADHSPS